jgi:hypothetical protein
MTEIFCAIIDKFIVYKERNPEQIMRSSQHETHYANDNDINNNNSST